MLAHQSHALIEHGILEPEARCAPRLDAQENQEEREYQRFLREGSF